MAKILITLLLSLNFLIAFGQKKQNYYAQIYNPKSKESRGVILGVTDSTITSRWKGKEKIWKISEIKSIRIYRLKKHPFFYFPSYLGLACIAASPFRSNLRDGLGTAAAGVAILFVSASAEVAFRKTYERITVAKESDLKKRLEKYIWSGPETVGAQ
ncbi:hypothetical protein [Desertivirga brevis]|uniref:hypothetical protein n=1 Tax=Desertivirga brevis TaxID=2810310 RepID=UPI001A96323F|nr:hypothetical protein [Pedobacter sp. SYSU D00873]